MEPLTLEPLTLEQIAAARIETVQQKINDIDANIVKKIGRKI